MKMTTMKRMLAGLSLVAVAAGSLMFGGAGRADVSGNAVDCAQMPSACQVAPVTDGSSPSVSPLHGIVAPIGPARLPDPMSFVDLGITLLGYDVDGSPTIQITNFGTEDSGKFQVLERSAAGSTEREFQNLAAGQSIEYHDPLSPRDCGSPLQLILAKHERPDSNASNDTLTVTPRCGGQATEGPIG